MRRTLHMVLSIVILIIFMLPMLLRVGIMVNFSVQQDFIAKVLCVNKNVTGSTCNGKCHLKKKLNATEEDKSDKNSITLKENPLSSYYYSTNLLGYNQLSLYAEKILFSVYIAYQKSTYFNQLFRPPQSI